MQPPLSMLRDDLVALPMPSVPPSPYLPLAVVHLESHHDPAGTSSKTAIFYVYLPPTRPLERGLLVQLHLLCSARPQSVLPRDIAHAVAVPLEVAGRIETQSRRDGDTVEYVFQNDFHSHPITRVHLHLSTRTDDDPVREPDLPPLLAELTPKRLGRRGGGGGGGSGRHEGVARFGTVYTEKPRPWSRVEHSDVPVLPGLRYDARSESVAVPTVLAPRDGRAPSPQSPPPSQSFSRSRRPAPPRSSPSPPHCPAVAPLPTMTSRYPQAWSAGPIIWKRPSRNRGAVQTTS
ncbi:hypothetical protein C8Q78DRAFT_716770 [Trametes maxima]|nr:hypothetical protein C8Q78DRAFT_716770 [Trametes maxima]